MVTSFLTNTFKNQVVDCGLPSILTQYTYTSSDLKDTINEEGSQPIGLKNY